MDQKNIALDIRSSDLIFLVGPNGTGKSTLLIRIKQQLGANARTIVAHRQNWFETAAIQLTQSSRDQTFSHISGQEASEQARTRDLASGQKNNVLIFDLADRQNHQAQKALKALQDDHFELAKSIAKERTPVEIISSILQSSGIPVQILLKGGRFVATRNGSTEYEVTDLSDGERNAFFIASEALTMPVNCVLLIDEPERHLHRSIAAPLIASILELRPDCAFVVSTHELALPTDLSSSRVVQLHAYDPINRCWDVEVLEGGTPIRDSAVDAILGMRRRLLIVEGKPNSLDIQLYRILFPSVSVIAKETAKDVGHVVDGINNSAEHHHCDAVGIVDGDAMTTLQREGLAKRRVFPLNCYSIEYLYYNRLVFSRVVETHAQSHGIRLDAALLAFDKAVLTAMVGSREQMIGRVCEKRVREQAFVDLPDWRAIAGKILWEKSINTATDFEPEGVEFDCALEREDVNFFLARYPFRHSGVLGKIAEICGFSDRSKYEHCVRTLAQGSEDLRRHLHDLIGAAVAALSEKRT